MSAARFCISAMASIEAPRGPSVLITIRPVSSTGKKPLGMVMASQTATAKDATPGQVALAWLLAQRPWIVPIPGTRRLSRVEENAGSATVALSADERAELDHLTETIRVAGNRYNDAGMAMVGR